MNIFLFFIFKKYLKEQEFKIVQAREVYIHVMIGFVCLYTSLPS
jgi:hypothetical protein